MKTEAWNEYKNGADASYTDKAYFIEDFSYDNLREQKVSSLYSRYRESLTPALFESITFEKISQPELSSYITRYRENDIGLHSPLCEHFRENLAELNALISANPSVASGKSLYEIVEAKYKKLYDVAYRVAANTSIKRHAFICGAAGVGKTFTVSKGVANGAKLSGRPVVDARGDIGSSLTNIIGFLFKNRNNKIVVLDDCDGFFLNANQSIMNILKAALDPSQKPFDIAKTIQNKINKESAKKEGITIDISRIRENVVSYRNSSDLSILYEEKITTNDRQRFLESLSDEDDIEADIDKELGLTKYIPRNELAKNDSSEELPTYEDENSDEEVPDRFAFKSSVIFISNLAVSKVDSAVISRCNVVEFTLSREEFVCRLKQVMPTLLEGVTSISKPYLEWAKENAYKYLLACVDAAENGKKIGTKKVTISIPMEFRLFSDLVDDWVADAQEYADKYNTMDLAVIEKAIAPTYVLDAMIPRLAGRM